MSDDKRIWGIHTLDDNLFLKNNVIAIGWPDFGDLSKVTATREAFKERYAQIYPNDKPGAIPTSAGMLYRFIHEIRIGDYVVFPSKVDRMVNIGIVEGDYTYADTEKEYVQQRKVKWIKHLPRTSFTQGALYEIGSAMSLFMVKNYADEYLAALDKGFTAEYGAREMDRVIAQELKPMLTREILFGQLKQGGTINITYKDGSLSIG